MANSQRERPQGVKRRWTATEDHIGQQAANGNQSTTAGQQLGSPHEFERPLRQPTISRRVKACASCRKMKIKCLMDDNGPPCARCRDRGLSCVLNKSLQTILGERSHWREAVTHDINNLQEALQEVLKRLSLPPLPGLSVMLDEASGAEDVAEIQDEVFPSCDASPQLLPKDDDTLVDVPISSLYRVTGLRSFRSHDEASIEQGSTHATTDFITKGIISLEDAERLVKLYLNRLDHFIYGVGGRYKDLDSMRKVSPILTACICTVAALHEPGDTHLYTVCNREFRRLMSSSMFDRRVDRDHLRAMCIGSYWLADISWMLSGYAVRRAIEVNLEASYNQVVLRNQPEAVDCMRLWYSMYICDQHLSILYGRGPGMISRDNPTIQGWEAYLKSTATDHSDQRLVSQVALLVIMSNVRELFGSDHNEPIPRAFTSQIANFSRQLDQWLGYWSSLAPNMYIGDFPAKGVQLHYHFARLQLYSHCFRGLTNASVPVHFRDGAAAAIGAASSIIELLLNDQDLAAGLRGIPAYLHSMTAFACVFLLKIATKFDNEYCETAYVTDLTARFVTQLRATPVGKVHLCRLMADGLEKMVRLLVASTPRSVDATLLNAELSNTDVLPDLNAMQSTGNLHFDGFQTDGFMDMATLGNPFLQFDSANSGLDYSTFGFG